MNPLFRINSPMKTLDKYLTSAMNGVIVISLALMVIMVFSNVV